MANDEWQTPQEIFDALDREFGFDLDVACNSKNCKCRRGIMTDHGGDAIEGMCWETYAQRMNAHCWMNPPYSRGKITEFCKKAYKASENGCTVVALLPGDCSTAWFRTYVMRAKEIRFLPRRVRFINPETGKPGGAPTFGSIIVIWDRYTTNMGMYSSPKVRMWDWRP